MNPQTHILQNARDLEQELQWFTQVLDAQLRLYLDLEPEYEDIHELIPPDFTGSASDYAQLLEQYAMGFEERVALMLSLAPHLQPQLLDVFFTKNQTFDRPFAEFGGTIASSQGGFLPTGVTLLFILGGNNLAARLDAQQLLDRAHPFWQARILRLGIPPPQGNPLDGSLEVSLDLLSRLTKGRPYEPEFGVDFPARQIRTKLTWEDLILNRETLRQLAEIKSWAYYGKALMEDWEMGKKLRPGYRSLFYGPPGTGKTMTACLLGKETDRAVYKVDLSLMVSKYIGETEKNLSKVFDQAEHKDWILFFDEADALFGKRTQVQDAHDRYANQEVSYLLQRIEVFDGIVILASNLRSNLDDAFTRRFESIIYFPMPQPEERLRIWERGFPQKAAIDSDVDLPQLAEQYELSGGGIMNVIRFAALRALENGATIRKTDLLEGVGLEYAKEGRTV